MMSPFLSWMFGTLLVLGATLSINAAHSSDPPVGGVKRGQAIYLKHCAECHGLEGRGDGPRAPFLAPRPGNLVSAATSSKTDAEILGIIKKGKPRTAMKGWEETLSEEESVDVLVFIRSLVHFQQPSLTPPPPPQANQ